MHANVLVEKRQAIRHAVDLPIDLNWNETPYHARTLDVSAEGISVLLDRAMGLEAGEVLAFALTLQHAYPGAISRLQGHAVVVRTERRESLWLIAFRAQCLATVWMDGAGTERLLLS